MPFRPHGSLETVVPLETATAPLRRTVPLQGGLGPTELFLLVLIVLLVGVMTVLAVSVYLTYWVYRDAEARGESGLLWATVVSLTGPIGVGVYVLAVRD